MYNYWPSVSTPTVDPTGLYLSPYVYKTETEQWYSETLQRPTSVNAGGVFIKPEYVNDVLPTISWVCACDLCVLSVQEFINALNTSDGSYAATISSVGPTYNSLLTSGVNPSIQVLAIQDQNGAPVLNETNEIINNNSVYSYENGYYYNSTFPAYRTGGGAGLLPTPSGKGLIGQAPLYPAYNSNYVEANNYSATFGNFMHISTNNKLTCYECATSFADVAAQAERGYDLGNNQR